jgi:hypothetical protein
VRVPRNASSSARAGRTASRGQTIAAVEAIGRTLPDVEVARSWGVPALKVRGKMFACVAINKSAEPNSLMVRMAFADRDALIEDDPATYYLKDHYAPYPCVLVRLNRVSHDALRDLLTGAHRFIGARTPRRRSPKRSA